MGGPNFVVTAQDMRPQIRRGRRRSIRLGALGAALLIVAPAAHAQTLKDSAAALRAEAAHEYQLAAPSNIARALSLWMRVLPLERRMADTVGEGNTLAAIGMAYRDIGRADSALVYFRKALPIFRALGDRASESGTLMQLGRIYGAIGEPDSALTCFRATLSLARALGDKTAEAVTLNNIGQVHDRTGRPDSALADFRAALLLWRAVGDRYGEAITLNNIGSTYQGIGEPDSALAYDRRAMTLSHAVGDSVGEAITINNIGGIFWRTGQQDSALAYYHLALPILRAVGDRIGEGTVLNNIGLVYRDIGQPDSALAYFHRALLPSQAAGDRMGEAQTLSNIGLVFGDIHRPDSALVYDRQALAIQHAIGDQAGEAVTLNNIGRTFFGADEADSALTYFRQALSRSRAAGDPRQEAVSLSNLGVLFADIGRQDSALVQYRAALPIISAVGDRAAEAMVLANIAFEYRAVAQLDSAVAYYDRSTALWISVSRRAGSDFNQLSFNETSASIYENWTLAWLARASFGGAGPATRNAVNSDSAAYGALAASERGRARALLDLMRDTVARIAPGADLPAEGARLAASLRRRHSAALVYVSTPDTLIVWLLPSRGEVQVFRRAMDRDTVAAQIGRLRRSLGVDHGRSPEVEGDAGRAGAAADPAAWRRSSEALGASVLPPDLIRELEGEREIVIVPTGALALVPFTALPASSGGPPLGARWAIRYAPSLATLDQAEARTSVTSSAANTAALRPALVVGNPSMPVVRLSSGTRERLSPLPGAEKESREIAARLGVEALTGAAASEAAVLRALPGAPVVHLATHGFAYSSEAQARNSFVALAPDSVHDGLLTVGTILDTPSLQLSADLVVLSACQTGLGDLKQAEGTVGLQRAFLARGARSVLVSLWSVSDASTRALMTSFYRHWLKDADHPDKAESLRRAQEDVRHTKGWEDPRYWASFQLVGAQ